MAFVSDLFRKPRQRSNPRHVQADELIQNGQKGCGENTCQARSMFLPT